MLTEMVRVDTRGLSTRELNSRLRQAAGEGVGRIELQGVCGQRYIGTGLDRPIEIDIYGTPGNDLGIFMDGPRITVHGNAQDGCGNTMNEGLIVVHGHAGDITGLSARGGSIFVRDDVGYRAGIHMKEYGERRPVLVVGGTAQDFPGEYMAGGIIILLGLTLGEGESHRARFIGTGMHGGVIYIRGNIDEHQLGREVGVAGLNENDRSTLAKYVAEFADYFSADGARIMSSKFAKLYPRWLRPYGRLYAY